MEKRQVEVLAPAGLRESTKAAVVTGADAIYMGGSRSGARAYADSPDERGLVEAIDHVHLHERRLYMTVNTLFKESELKELATYMKPYYDQGLDEVIVQDLGALQILGENFSGLELHTNTQMTITSVYGARMLKDLDCNRVATSREMPLDEIRHIHEQVDVKVGSFVRGALCYCHLGQCLMGSPIGEKGGNRGRYTQPCRLLYRVHEGEEGKSAVLNRESERCVLSLKDLCALDILPDIIDSGVYSPKIEGRMKNPRYTVGVVSICCRYMDLYLEQGRREHRVEGMDRKMLLDLFDRGGSTSGYYEAHNGRDMVALKEKPELKEESQKFFGYLGRTYVIAQQKEPVNSHMILETGKPSVMTLGCGGVKVAVSGQAPEVAQKQPTTEEKILKQPNKTGNTSFVFEHLSAELKGDLFLPVQALNELRKSGLESLQSAILKEYRRGPGMSKEGALFENKDSTDSSEKPIAQPWILVVPLEEPYQLEPAPKQQKVSDVCMDVDGFGPNTQEGTVDRYHKREKSCYLTLPRIFRSHVLMFFRNHMTKLEHAGFDGVMVHVLEGVRWLEDQWIALPFIADAPVHTRNSRAIGELALREPQVVTMPWKLSSRELGPILAVCSRAGVPEELMVYEYAPMVVLTQCIARTIESCTHKRGLLRMKDRTGAVLMVKNHCYFCYNTIYNPSPLSLLGNEGLIRRIGIVRVRLQSTVEDGQQAGRVLEAFSRAFMGGETAEPPFKDFTRGHFRREVE